MYLYIHNLTYSCKIDSFHDLFWFSMSMYIAKYMNFLCCVHSLTLIPTTYFLYIYIYIYIHYAVCLICSIQPAYSVYNLLQLRAAKSISTIFIRVLEFVVIIELRNLATHAEVILPNEKQYGGCSHCRFRFSFLFRGSNEWTIAAAYVRYCMKYHKYIYICYMYKELLC
jgi:hypothetical protein